MSGTAVSRPHFWAGIISIFPDMFDALSSFGITGRACQNGLLKLERFNPRDFTSDPYRRVDDRPFGGGAGMVMMAEPLAKAIDAARLKALQDGFERPRVIYLSPQGRTLDESGVTELAARESVIFLCGRYEGVDERLLQTCVDEEWSIGDYVLSGGELPAMVILDSITRRFPGALGTAESLNDSFSDGLLDYPQYTRPDVFSGLAVPGVLKTGHHLNIEKWRFLQQIHRTRLRRPELLQNRIFSRQQQRWLAEPPAAEGSDDCGAGEIKSDG